MVKTPTYLENDPTLVKKQKAKQNRSSNSKSPSSRPRQEWRSKWEERTEVAISRMITDKVCLSFYYLRLSICHSSNPGSSWRVERSWSARVILRITRNKSTRRSITIGFYQKLPLTLHARQFKRPHARLKMVTKFAQRKKHKALTFVARRNQTN